MLFAKPEMLWLLAAILPLLTLFLWWAWRKRQQLVRRFVQSRLLAQLTVGVSPARQRFRMVLLAVATGLILIALARPLYGYSQQEFRRRGVDIAVAIDVSRSMLAGDLQPDRLTRAKLAALDLMKLAGSDRLALVAFAGKAFLQCPLTIDAGAFQESVNALDTETITQQGTALGEAIDTAVTAFEQGNDNFKALVIFSDGEDHETGVLAAARRAADAGVRIYTLGVGTPEGDQLRLHNEKGETTYIEDAAGRPVLSRLNDGILREIAQVSEGEYLPLKGTEAVRQIYENRIAQLPASDYGARLGRQYHERFQWPLGTAILLLVLEMMLPYRRRVRRAELGGVNPGALGRLTPVLLGLLLLPAGRASERQALKAYQQGDYQAARDAYQGLLIEKSDDTRLHYNAGAAAYRMGEFAEAANEFSAAILSSNPDLLHPAYHNLGNSLFRLGEQAADPQEKMQFWQQAVRTYDAAVKLAPEDQDTQFNRDVVQAKLELLKQQQQQQEQQQEQDQNEQKKPDQSQDQSAGQKSSPQEQSSKPDESNPSPDQQQNQQESKDGQRDDQQPQDQQSQSPSPDAAQDQQSKESSSSAPNSPPQDQQTKPDPAGSDASKPDQQGAQPPQSGQPEDAAKAPPPGQMTPEQARRLLEAARNDERHWNEAEQARVQGTVTTDKPW